MDSKDYLLCPIKYRTGTIVPGPRQPLQLAPCLSHTAIKGILVVQPLVLSQRLLCLLQLHHVDAPVRQVLSLKGECNSA